MPFYFHSFIYAPLFQNLLELDCFSASNTPSALYSSKQRIWGKMLFLAESSGRPTHQRELSFQLWSCGWLHTLLPEHTGVSLQQCALTFSGFCYMTPFLILLRTVTVKGARQAQRPLLWTCLLKALVSLSFDLSSFQTGRDDQLSCDRGGRGYKSHPPHYLAGIESHDTFSVFSYLLSHIIHTSHSCICARVFLFVFKEQDWVKLKRQCVKNGISLVHLI